MTGNLLGLPGESVKTQECPKVPSRKGLKSRRNWRVSTRSSPKCSQHRSRSRLLPAHRRPPEARMPSRWAMRLYNWWRCWTGGRESANWAVGHRVDCLSAGLRLVVLSSPVILWGKESCSSTTPRPDDGKWNLPEGDLQDRSEGQTTPSRSNHILQHQAQGRVEDLWWKNGIFSISTCYENSMKWGYCHNETLWKMVIFW